MRVYVRHLLTFVCVAFAFTAAIWVVAALTRPDVSDRRMPYTPEQVASMQLARKADFDPAALPTVFRDKQVTPTGESPLLADLVAKGQLPPLKDRLPEHPLLLQGVEGVGKYGGTWRRLAPSASDIDQVIAYRMSGSYLVRWSTLGYPVTPHIAESLTSNDDKKIWTLKLRKGLRWSDGEFFTADDIMYWWNDEVKNKVIGQMFPPFMRIGGTEGHIEFVNTLEVRFVFDKPYGTFMEALANQTLICASPKHYLKPYHPDPKIGDAAFIKKELTTYGLPSASALYTQAKKTNNPLCPRLWPWIYRTFKANPPQVLVRNPYFFAVDEAGNQLPYVDRIQYELTDLKILPTVAGNGGVSMQERHIQFADYTELMSRQASAGTRILHWFSGTRSPYTINPNLNRRVDPADPTTAQKAKLLADKHFRQALSIAINRKEIIRAEYNGITEPSQIAAGPESPFHNEKAAKAFIEYDPAGANRMLDELGLNVRDSEGYRTFPDGTRMSFNLDYSDFTGPGPAQFIVDDWQAVGIRCAHRSRTRPLMYAEKDGLDFDFNVWTGESDFMPVQSPRYLIPQNAESFWAVGWGRWVNRGGFYNLPGSKVNGAIPVPKDSPAYEAIRLYELARMAPTLAEQKALMEQVSNIAAENVWSISLTTPPPQLVVVKSNFHNVPENSVSGSMFASPSNAGIETFYFDDAHDSAGAIADMRNSLIHPDSLPSAAPRTKTSVFGTIVGWSFTAIPILLVVMLGLRHPFIGRRLLIMVPTLLAISVIVFTIIQLPPGDYLTSRIIALQESGDGLEMKSIEDLKTFFRFDEPAWKQYTRWMGLHWFVTFNSNDTGLLQGNMGRSMETSRPINQMVGDRIVLTVAMSLGTIVFTWLTAIPIGIYSAVRQYTWSDYALTLLGFLGMCFPAFLLALVLTAISGATGLFSPEYAIQPEWDWGKFVDLMKHIWIPVVVLGVGGTAGMIRVMRANLLDELRKPYVTTAMAKGVRPMRLLLKYPVRMALNPFISGIGALFPQLVSGGAIVSLVLALPTAGPMLLSALFTEDMYLAGSMLMVLSILGVVGTLVSDILLLWLDPRIRLGGGTR